LIVVALILFTGSGSEPTPADAVDVAQNLKAKVPQRKELNRIDVQPKHLPDIVAPNQQQEKVQPRDNVYNQPEAPKDNGRTPAVPPNPVEIPKVDAKDTDIASKKDNTPSESAVAKSSNLAKGNFKQASHGQPIQGWGVVTDPDNDCEFFHYADDNKLTIVVPGTLHDYDPLNPGGKRNAPWVLHEIQGDFSLRVRLAPGLLADKGTLLPGKTTATASAMILIRQDDKNFVCIRRERISHPVGNPRPYEQVVFYSVKDGERIVDQVQRIERTETLLQVERHGNNFVVRCQLEVQGQHVELQPLRFGLELAAKLQVGVAAANVSTQPLQMEFDLLRLDVAGDKGGKNLAREPSVDVTPAKDSPNTGASKKAVNEFLPGQSIKGWGVVVDPNKDCKFLASDDTELTIVVPNVPHDFHREKGYAQFNGPRVLQRVKGDFTLQVSTDAYPAIKPIFASSKRAPWISAGLVIWQDANNYIRLDSARNRTITSEGCANGSNLLYKPGHFYGKEVLLQIQRQGDKFILSMKDESKDPNWQEINQYKVKFGSELGVGVFASNLTTEEFASRFRDFKLTPTAGKPATDKKAAQPIYLASVKEVEYAGHPTFRLAKGYTGAAPNTVITVNGKQYPKGLGMHPPPDGLAKVKYLLNGTVITVNGKQYPKGLGMHPPPDGLAKVKYLLNGKMRTFSATVAINDSAEKNTSLLRFRVLGDGKLLWESNPLDTKGRTQDCTVDVSGVKILELHVFCPGPENWAHAVWLDPYVSPVPQAVAKKTDSGPDGKRVLLTTLKESSYAGHPVFFLGKGFTGSDQQTPIQVNGKRYPNGLGTHPPGTGLAKVTYPLNGKMRTFSAVVAINDSAEQNTSPLQFRVVGDGKALWQSKALNTKGLTQACKVDVSGVNVLELQVFCAGAENWAHAVWLDPYVTPAPEPSAKNPEPPPNDNRVLLATLKEQDFKGRFGLGKGYVGGDDKETIKFSGQLYPNGLGTHPPSDGVASVKYKLKGNMSTFSTTVAVNDSALPIISPLQFKVLGDNKLLWASNPLNGKGLSQECNVDITGVKMLELQVWCQGPDGYAHAVWLDPYVLPNR
jgi:regulation of enolase protein 1 (concanavalin A-like superfamily)